MIQLDLDFAKRLVLKAYWSFIASFAKPILARVM